MTDTPVQKIANFMAKAEQRSRQNVAGARALKDEFAAVTGVPELTRGMLFSKLDALNTNYAADLLELHRQMTDAALNHGVDVPPVGENDGDGVMTPMGGGGGGR